MGMRLSSAMAKNWRVGFGCRAGDAVDPRIFKGVIKKLSTGRLVAIRLIVKDLAVILSK